MRQRVWIGAAGAVLSVSTVGAQAPASSPAGTSQRGSNSVTITGCVERADQLGAGGGSTLGTTVDSLDFVLIRAQVSGEASQVPTGTAGTAATAPAASASGAGSPIGPVFRLEGNTDLINPHVGHRVEVVGTRGATPAPDVRASGNGNALLASAPLVRVQSLTMIAETCTPR